MSRDKCGVSHTNTPVVSSRWRSGDARTDDCPGRARVPAITARAPIWSPEPDLDAMRGVSALCTRPAAAGGWVRDRHDRQLLRQMRPGRRRQPGRCRAPTPRCDPTLPARTRKIAIATLSIAGCGATSTAHRGKQPLTAARGTRETPINVSPARSRIECDRSSPWRAARCADRPSRAERRRAHRITRDPATALAGRSRVP